MQPSYIRQVCDQNVQKPATSSQITVFSWSELQPDFFVLIWNIVHKHRILWMRLSRSHCLILKFENNDTIGRGLLVSSNW